MSEVIQKYQKKPVVIEAVRLSTKNAEKVLGWINTMGKASQMPDDAKLFGNAIGTEIRGIYIPTLEGVMEAGVGDWIIRGVAGEFYPCKHDIFLQTYSERTYGT